MSHPAHIKTPQTVYTGDIIDGVPVISQLNVDDLLADKIHRFMFKGASMNIGQSWYVPVMVARGRQPGPKILLNTGIHGDELNGSRVIHHIFQEINPQLLRGTLIGVTQASPNSLLHISKNWYLSTDGGDFENMNRIFPGKKDGNTAMVHAYHLWHDLWQQNVDLAIDLHCQSTDTLYPLFVFADYRNPGVKRLAELIPADQIKIDEGEKGTLETTFIEHGIPAITIEVGAARIYQEEYILRACEGIRNILRDQNMLSGSLERTAHSFGSYVGTETASVRAAVGGYADILVTLGSDVSSGQLVAVQRNPFGDVIQEYTAPVAGKVVSLSDSATREAGGLLVRILY